MFSCCCCDAASGGAQVICPMSSFDEASGPYAQWWGAADGAKSDEAKADFTAEMMRADASQELGLQLEVIDNSSVFIARVDDSGSTAVAHYNSRVPRHVQIVTGDCIVAANDEQEVFAMLSAMREAAQLRLKIRRVRIIPIVVQKRGRPLGLSMRYEQGGASLIVTHVDGAGAIAVDRLDIVPGDRIVAVNGREGSSTELLREVQTCDTLEIGLSRRPV